MYVRPHWEEMRMTKAVESSAAKPRDGVSLHIRVPIARVTLYLCETKREGREKGVRGDTRVLGGYWVTRHREYIYILIIIYVKICT